MSFSAIENITEAEHDLWRKIYSQGSFLRNQLQCSVHSATGNVFNVAVFLFKHSFRSVTYLFLLQGLEIVNPQAAEKKVAEANQKYFSNMAEFLKVKKEAKN